MHRSLARYSAPVSFVQAPSWADFITAMVGFEVFGTHKEYVACAPDVGHQDVKLQGRRRAKTRTIIRTSAGRAALRSSITTKGFSSWLLRWPRAASLSPRQLA